MANNNVRFVAKNGLDNNGNTLTNLGVTGASLTQAGAFALTLTTTGATNVTFPTSGTLATTTGTISSATNLSAGSTGALVYQSATGTTAYLTAGTSSQVLVGGASAPSWSNTPTLTGTNFTGIPNGALTNSSVTIGSTNVALGATATTLAGLTSVTSTGFTGALTGAASSNVLKTGDTMSGPLTLSFVGSVLNLDNSSGANGAFLVYKQGGLSRWTLYKDSTAESGSNAGSNFAVITYNDAGSYLSTPVTITRSTGLVTLSGGLSVTGTIAGTTFSGSGASLTNIPNSGLTNSSITVTGGTGLGVSGSPVSLGGTVTLSNTGVTSAVAGTNIAVSGATGAVTISVTGTVPSATNATNIGITDDTSTNATMYPTWVTANTGNLPAKVSSTKMTFNPSTGTLTSTVVNGGQIVATTGAAYSYNNQSGGTTSVNSASIIAQFATPVTGTGSANSFNYGLISAPQIIGAPSGASSTGAFGLIAIPAIISSATTSFVTATGVSGSALRSNAADASTNASNNLSGVIGFAGHQLNFPATSVTSTVIGVQGVAQNFSGVSTTFTGVSSLLSFGASGSTTNASSTSVAAFNATATLGGGTGTYAITNLYGLRLQAPSIGSGMTITNRYGISQEDTSAINYLAGNVGIGMSPSYALDVTGYIRMNPAISNVSFQQGGTTQSVFYSGTLFQNSSIFDASGKTVTASILAPRISLSTGNGSGVASYAVMAPDATASTNVGNWYGAYGLATRSNANDTSTVSGLVVGSYGQASHGNGIPATASSTTVAGVYAAGTISGGTVTNTVTSLYTSTSVNIGASTLNISIPSAAQIDGTATYGSTSTGTTTITSLYGLRLRAPTINSGVTITNRYGVSSEDASAINYFAGSVGIGGNPPSSKLDVNGGSSTTVLTVQASGFTGNKTQLSLDITGRSVLASSSTYPLAFDVNGSERMRIDSVGQVGIGAAATAGYKLDVRGNAIIGDRSAGDASVEIGLLRTSDGNAYIDFQAASASSSYDGRLIRGSGTNGGFTMTNRGTGTLAIQQENTGAISLNVNGSALAVLQSGTTYLINNLHETRGTQVNFRRASTDSSPFYQAFIKTRGTVASPTTVVNGDAIGSTQYYGHDGTSERQSASINCVVDAVPATSTVAGALTFLTTPSGTSQNPVERMRINSTGQIGINMLPSSTSARVQVTGAVHANCFDTWGTAEVYNPSGGMSMYYNGAGVGVLRAYSDASGTAGVVSFVNPAGEYARFDASGNLGLKTASITSPFTLDVNGGARMRGELDIYGTSTDRLAMAALTAGSGSLISSVNAANSAYTPLNLTGSIIALQIGGVEKARLDASGNLGIGVTPSYKLQVQSGAAGTASLITSGASGNNVTLDVGRTAAEVRVAVAAAANDFINDTNGAGVVAGDAMLFSPTGNLYVGTTVNKRLSLVTNQLSRITITAGTGGSSGVVGINSIGIASSRLRVQAGGTGSENTIEGYFGSTGQTGATFLSTRQDATGKVASFVVATVEIGSITHPTTSSTAYNTSSDIRLKENIKPAESFGNVIDSIEIVEFDWKNDKHHERAGTIAQSLVTIVPEAVKVGDTNETITDTWAVDYSKLVPMLIKEIQELRARVAQLEAK